MLRLSKYLWFVRMKVNKIVELRTQYSFEAPVFDAHGKAGTSQSAELKNKLDLNSYLAPFPGETYLVKVSGESMINEGIYDGDILVVNKKDRPVDGKVVIASLNGEMAVKTYRDIGGVIYLFSANDKFLPIEIKPFWEFEIQGVVKHVIHAV
jgi:DNA polymerase V